MLQHLNERQVPRFPRGTRNEYFDSRISLQKIRLDVPYISENPWPVGATVTARTRVPTHLALLDNPEQEIGNQGLLLGTQETNPRRNSAF